jgi:hypothetical protein
MQSQIPVIKEIHDAVAAGNLVQAERLMTPYREHVVAAWQAATSDSERQAIAADVNALLEWARITTISARAHAQNKLVVLQRDSAYSGGSGNRPAFNLEA